MYNGHKFSNIFVARLNIQGTRVVTLSAKEPETTVKQHVV